MRIPHPARQARRGRHRSASLLAEGIRLCAGATR